MPLERTLITCMGSSALSPAQAVSGLVATGAHVGLARNGFLPARDVHAFAAQKGRCLRGGQHRGHASGRACNRRSATLGARARMTARVSIQEATPGSPVSSVPVAACTRSHPESQVSKAQSQEVVCPRAGTVVQKQPRDLQVLDTGDPLEEAVVSLELKSLLDVSVAAEGRAKNCEPLFGGR